MIFSQFPVVVLLDWALLSMMEMSHRDLVLLIDDGAGLSNFSRCIVLFVRAIRVHE